MFAVVFPLAPLFAYVNNLWEFKLDLSQLCKTRRPQVWKYKQRPVLPCAAVSWKELDHYVLITPGSCAGLFFAAVSAVCAERTSMVAGAKLFVLSCGLLCLPLYA